MRADAVEAEEDTAASAEGDMLVSAAVPILAELVVATLEGLAEVVLVMAAGITHPESQPDVTAVITVTGKGLMYREARPDASSTVLARARKAGPLHGSLLVRQNTLAAITSREINPELALQGNPTSSRVTIREQLDISASNVPTQRQAVQRDRATHGRDRTSPTGRDSTHKQRRDCVTGTVEHVTGRTQSITTRNTGVIVTIMITIGGINIATQSFLLAGVSGAGMTVGGTRHGGTIHTIPITITMVRSMAMTDFDPTRSSPTFRQRCSNWDTMCMQLTEYWGRQLKQPSRTISATTAFPSPEQSMHQQ